MFKFIGSTTVYDMSPNKHSIMLVLISIVEDAFPDGFRLVYSQCEVLESLCVSVGSSDAVLKLLKAIESELKTIDCSEAPPFYDEEGDVNTALEWAANVANTISSREAVRGATEEYKKQVLVRLERDDANDLREAINQREEDSLSVEEQQNTEHKLSDIINPYADCLQSLTFSDLDSLPILPTELGSYIETMNVCLDWGGGNKACLSQMWTALSQGRVPSKQCFEQTLRELGRIQHFEAAKPDSIPNRVVEVIQFLTGWSARTHA